MQDVDFKNVEDGLAGLIPFEDDGDGNSGDKMDLRGKPVNADMGKEQEPVIRYTLTAEFQASKMP
jgi:hypothetical protein